MSEAKVAAIWDFRSSPVYEDAERAALEFALAAGSVPNGVLTDEHMARLREHWTDDEIAEILAAICRYAFLNRWNDTLATDMETGPLELGDRVFAVGGWTGGKHLHRG